jgi:hypothetical protein
LTVNPAHRATTPLALRRRYEYAADTAAPSDARRSSYSGNGGGALGRTARPDPATPTVADTSTGGGAAVGSSAGLSSGAGQGSSFPSAYDLEIIREVILVAEERARREYAQGSGGRELTLVKLLQAYEQVRGCPRPRPLILQYTVAARPSAPARSEPWP